MFLGQHCASDAVLTPFYHPEPGHRPRNWQGPVDPEPELTFMGEWATGCAFGGSTPSEDSITADVASGRRFYEAMPAWQVRARLGNGVFDRYFSVAVERNPWDKVLSRLDHYNTVNRHGKVLSVDDLLDHLEQNGQSPFFQLAPHNFPRYADPWTGELVVDQILRYESLESDLAIVRERFSLPHDLTVPHLAKSGFRRNGHYRERLTTAQGRRIARIFAHEISLLDYRW